MRDVTIDDLQATGWFHFITPKQQTLAQLSVGLYEREKQSSSHFEDYSFVVFPLAKVYEGFLKKYFLELQLITQEQYTDKRFRIGRALNPDVNMRHQDEYWLFDDVSSECGKAVANKLWETWLNSRNHIFHYFPDTDDYLTLQGAEDHLKQLSSAMEEAIQCKWH